jgi:hypothetical protein
MEKALVAVAAAAEISKGGKEERERKRREGERKSIHLLSNGLKMALLAVTSSG